MWVLVVVVSVSQLDGRYGLDYAQKYRGLPFIGVVAPWVHLLPHPDLMWVVSLVWTNIVTEFWDLYRGPSGGFGHGPIYRVT